MFLDVLTRTSLALKAAKGAKVMVTPESKSTDKKKTAAAPKSASADKEVKAKTND